MQKNRFFTKPKTIKLIFGDSAFITDSEGRLELIQLKFLKKRVKKYVLKRDHRFEYDKEKMWYFLTPNFLIQKKSKNSRMGKGKGLTERKVVRVKKNIKIFEFSGVSHFFLKKMLFILNKKLSLKLKLISVKPKRINNWSSKLKYYTFYEKYLQSYFLN